MADSVALTRARSLCVIMGPLDIKGLVGAATVIGSLMYGAEHVFAGRTNFYLHHGSLRPFELSRVEIEPVHAAIPGWKKEADVEIRT